MQYNEVISRLQKLIKYVPSQSQLCEITGVKQSTMSQRAKDNSAFKLDDIEKINKHFGINLYTFDSNTHQNTITSQNKNKTRDELIKLLYSFNETELECCYNTVQTLIKNLKVLDKHKNNV